MILSPSATSPDKVWCVKHFIAHVTTCNGGFNKTLHVANRPLHYWNFLAHSNYNLRNKWF